jgi:energy-coupling factor transporter transmembrane protein EcfT
MRDFNRINLGMHYSVDSPVHRLDPRTKILGALALMVAAIATRKAAGGVVLVRIARAGI